MFFVDFTFYVTKNTLKGSELHHTVFCEIERVWVNINLNILSVCKQWKTDFPYFQTKDYAQTSDMESWVDNRIFVDFTY